MTTAQQIQEIKFDLLSMNNSYSKTCSSWKSGESIVAPAWEEADKVGNKFISSVIDSVMKYRKVSEKQAYCIARFIVENNVQISIMNSSLSIELA